MVMAVKMEMKECLEKLSKLTESRESMKVVTTTLTLSMGYSKPDIN